MPDQQPPLDSATHTPILERCSNEVSARRLVQKLVDQGVREFCMAAGSRNSPLVAVIAASPDLRSYFFFEERSAAFFALGRIQASDGRPVAVLTTSGTAAAELYPALIEAHYAGLPLIAVTADRPAYYRLSGAPQSIEQKNLYANYPEFFWEGPSDDQQLSWNALDQWLASWSGQKPIHLNIFFDEPLLERKVNFPRYVLSADPAPQAPNLAATENNGQALRALEGALELARRPLVILSGLPKQAHPEILKFCERLGAPVYVEAPSGLRENPRLQSLRVISGERQLEAGRFDLVLRFGSVPTCRFWRDLEHKFTDIKVLSFDRRSFSGLPRARHFQITWGPWLGDVRMSARYDLFEDFYQSDRRRFDAKRALFSKYPLSEPALFHALSRRIPNGARIFLGNSLPIREWDLAADFAPRQREIFANRGANGIDGETSTFLGLCAEDHALATSHVALLGDLTTLYDLSAPWILNQLEDPEFQIFVINNGGGRIFSRLPMLRHMGDELRREALELEHRISFEPWARMWNLGYELWDEGLAPLWPSARQGIVEIVPDNEASQNFWAEFIRLWE